MDQAYSRDHERAALLEAAAPLVQAFPGNIWLVHEIIRLPDGKIDKPPAPGYRTNDPDSWVSLEDAINVMLRYPPGDAGVGFAIVGGIIGFDFDDCIDADGTVVPEIATLITRLNSFGYRTVSGTGLRVVCRNKANGGVAPGKYTRWSEGGHKVEVFVGQHNSYNTFSATEANGQRVARRSRATRALLDEWLGTSGGGGGGGTRGNYGEFGRTSDLGKKARDQDALPDALTAIPHDDAIDRDLWVKIAGAMYAGTEGSEAGREAFIAWSETWIHHNENPDRDDSEDAETLWNSFDKSPPRAVGAGTIFELAKQHGWKWPEEKMKLDPEEPEGGTPEAEVMPPRLSEAALARRFAKRHRKQLRFVAAWAKWFWWNGAVWEEDTTEEVIDAAGRLLEEMAAECLKASQARSLTKLSTAKAVLGYARARSELAATTKQWDADPWALNTPGGVVDLRTGQLRPHRAADYMTKITAVTPDTSHPCPRWLKFLEEVMAGDADRIGYLQRICGYGLTGEVSEHMMWFGHGPGRNGKSKFIELLLWIMGSYAIAAPMETFTSTTSDNHPTELARLQGARLVTSSETEEGRHWAENRIKMLTGGDRITARFMRQDFFSFEPQFKLFIIGNHKPRLRNIDEAIKWRLQLIPFLVRISEEQRDTALMEKFKAEGPGILAWMVAGALRWQQEGLQPPVAVREATDDYINTEDALGGWLEERCETGIGLSAVTRDLHADYVHWLHTRGERKPPVERQFVQALTDRGFTKQKWTNHRKPREINGLQLKEGTTEEEGDDDDEL